MRNLIFSLGVVFAMSGNAAVVCTSGDTVATIDRDSGQFTIQIGQDSKSVAIDHDIWDGHSRGLITGAGFSFLYTNWYGCIRKAEVVTDTRFSGHVGNFSRIEFENCTGGTTADRLCYGGQ